jgi:tetratricopeptide (TPR) repeat protein
MTRFTTPEVAKILDLGEDRIRSCVRAGLLSPDRGPRRQLRFTFQDLLLLRTTKGLLDARVPLPRIRRMLTSLRRQLPDDARLAALSIYADGRRVVAWDGTARWQPDSGQFLFNFEAKAVARDVKAVAKEVSPIAAPPPLPATPARGPALSAEQWMTLASELEATSPAEARRAYHQALQLDPMLADAHINLGRLYHEAKEAPRAEAHYRIAIQHAPDDPIGHFNLAVLLDDLGRVDEAARAYRAALTRDRDFADAHYNLGLLLDRLGRRSDAIAHLRTARKLYGRP